MDVTFKHFLRFAQPNLFDRFQLLLGVILRKLRLSKINIEFTILISLCVIFWDGSITVILKVL